MAVISTEQLQILALAAIEDKTWEHQYRTICRWYSREFSTPLQVVEHDLNQIHVLTHYYEDSFERLHNSDSEESQQRYSEIRESVMRTQMSEAEIEELDAEDNDWEQQMQEEIAENVAKMKKHDEDKRAAEARKVEDAESLKNPNLEEELEFSVQGEQGPPDY